MHKDGPTYTEHVVEKLPPFDECFDHISNTVPYRHYKSYSGFTKENTHETVLKWENGDITTSVPQITNILCFVELLGLYLAEYNL